MKWYVWNYVGNTNKQNIFHNLTLAILRTY